MEPPAQLVQNFFIFFSKCEQFTLVIAVQFSLVCDWLRVLLGAGTKI